MNRCQGFPLQDVTIWVEDLGNGHYRVWYSHNDAPHRHYNEGMTRDPVAAVQENRGLVLDIFARIAAKKDPAYVRARRVEGQAMGVSMFITAACVVTMLVCFASLGPGPAALIILAVLYGSFRGLA